MKKLLLLFVSVSLAVLPAQAALNFYRAGNGNIVLETTDCNAAARFMGFVTPDDPPGKAAQPEDAADEQAGEQNIPTQAEAPQEEKPAVTPATQAALKQGTKTVLNSFLEEEQYTPVQRSKSFRDISSDDENFTAASSFEERQETFAVYVRDVNWKTGLFVTWRDYSLWRRIRMACLGISQMSKPFRVSFETYAGNLDETLDKTTDKGIDALANAARSHSFHAMSRLSLVGLADAIDKTNPFLLMAIDEDTYNKLVEENPQIGELFEDMYTFFKIRSARLGTEYDCNVKELIRISKIGKGNAFGTWHILSEYAKKMLALDRAGKLNPADEKDIHLWKLESAMHYIKEQVRVERRAAELAMQNPENLEIVKEVKAGPKKRPSLDEKAEELLRKSTQAEIKRLIRKYKGK